MAVRWLAGNAGRNLLTSRSIKCCIFMHLIGCLSSELKEEKVTDGRMEKMSSAGGWKTKTWKARWIYSMMDLLTKAVFRVGSHIIRMEE